MFSKKKRNRVKLIFTGVLKNIFYPVLFYLDKVNAYKYFAGIANKSLEILKINKQFNTYFDYKIYSEIFKDQFKGKSNGEKVILFPFTMGSSSSFNVRTLLTAKHMQNKGYMPIMLICDGALNICSHDRIYKNRACTALFCSSCYKHYDYIENITGITILKFSEFYYSELDDPVIKKEKQKIDVIRNIRELEEYSFDGVDVGVLTKVSVLRYFFKGALNESKENIAIYKRYLISSIKVCIICRRVFEKFNSIEKVILQNGSLNVDKVFAEFSKMNSIDYITQEVFIGSNSWIYKKNGIAIHLDWENEWQSKLNKNITSAEKEKVLQLFQGFRTGKAVGIKYNPESSSTDRIFVEGQRYAVLFTNLNFDTYTLGRDPLFDSMYSWVIETMDYWNKYVSDIKLIIRAHPAEIKLLTPSKDFLSNLVEPKLNDKFVFIDSTSDVSSYELFDKVEFGICYASTIGIELALANIPVIVAGEAFYKKYAINPKSKSDYFKHLDKLIDNTMRTNIEIEELINFLHFIYYEKTHHFKGFDVNRQIGHHSYSELDFERLFNLNKDVLEEFFHYIYN